MTGLIRVMTGLSQVMTGFITGDDRFNPGDDGVVPGDGVGWLPQGRFARARCGCALCTSTSGSCYLRRLTELTCSMHNGPAPPPILTIVVGAPRPRCARRGSRVRRSTDYRIATSSIPPDPCRHTLTHPKATRLLRLRLQPLSLACVLGPEQAGRHALDVSLTSRSCYQVRPGE